MGLGKCQWFNGNSDIWKSCNKTHSRTCVNARRVDSEREVAISNPTNSWPAHNLLPTEVSVDFSDFSSNFKSHNNALAAGLNFDRLSQRWDNNDRRAARLRGGSVSPRQPGFPRNTDRHLRVEILYFFLHFSGHPAFRGNWHFLWKYIFVLFRISLPT